MATYTSIPPYDLKKIATAYGIKAVDFIPIEGGNANSNYRIRAEEGDYMLTLAEEKPLQEVQHLVTFLQYLEQYDFDTSKVHPSLTGEMVTIYTGKPLFVKKWIKGKVYENLSMDMLKQIGVRMAKLHQIPVPDFLPKLHPYGLQVFPTVFDKGIDSQYESWLSEKMQWLMEKLPKNLPKGLIHGDVFFDNVLFEDGKLKAIIDFEEACDYYLNFDLGMGILGLCSTNEKIDWTKAKALIAGYEQIRPLTLLEKELLPLFVKYAAIATSWWRFWKYNIHTPNPDRKDKHWEMVKVVEEMDEVSFASLQ